MVPYKSWLFNFLVNDNPQIHRFNLSNLWQYFSKNKRNHAAYLPLVCWVLLRELLKHHSLLEVNLGLYRYKIYHDGQKTVYLSGNNGSAGKGGKETGINRMPHNGVWTCLY